MGGGFTYLKERAGWGAKRLLSVVKKSLQNGIEKKMGWFFEILFLGDRDFLKIYYLRDRRGTGRLMVPGERESGACLRPLPRQMSLRTRHGGQLRKNKYVP